MKRIVNGLVYNTDDIELVYNLSKNKPNKPSSYGNYYVNYWSGSTGGWVSNETTTSGLKWVVNPSDNSTNNVNNKKDDFTYETYIGKTKNNRFTVVMIKFAKSENDTVIPVSRTFLTYFKNTDELVSYLAEDYGYEGRVNKAIEDFFDKIGVELKAA